MSQFSQVTVSSEVRRTDKSTYVVYPVRLRAASGDTISLEESHNPDSARRAAERFAKFLSLPLVDSTYGNPIVRQPHELDESLRERAQRTGVRPEIPKTPPNIRSTYRIEGDTLVLEIPSSGFLRAFSFPMVVSLIAPLIAAWLFFFGAGAQEMSREFLTILLILAGGVVGLPLLSIGLPALHRGLQRTYVELTPQALTVTSRSPIYRSTTTIPADELEELEIVWTSMTRLNFRRPCQTILARSDNATVQFGEGLPVEELRWIRDVVHNMVTA